MIGERTGSDEDFLRMAGLGGLKGDDHAFGATGRDINVGSAGRRLDFNALVLPDNAREKENDYVMLADIWPAVRACSAPRRSWRRLVGPQADVDGNRTRRRRVAATTRFEGEGAHQVLGRPRAARAWPGGLTSRDRGGPGQRRIAGRPGRARRFCRRSAP
jgi:hypothetical protein